MEKRLIITLFIALIISSCSTENSTFKTPISSFEISSQSEFKVLTEISFQNTSENSTDFYWDFGDGNVSIEMNPTHKYDSAGIYIVQLISSNKIETDTSKQSLDIIEYSNGYLFCNGKFYDINSCRIEMNYIYTYPYSFKIIFKNGFEYESESWPVVTVHAEGEFKDGYFNFFHIGIGNVVFLDSNESVDLEEDSLGKINIIDSGYIPEIRIVSNGAIIYYKGEVTFLTIISGGD